MKYEKKSTFTNFRDLGGLETANGKTIISKKIYRSSKPSELNSSDKAMLDSLGLDTIIDLRCLEEVKQKPDYVPKGCKYIHAECFKEKDFRYIAVTLQAKIGIGHLKGKRTGIVKQQKWDSYKEMIDCKGFEEIWKCMDRGDTFLFHCTEGKDRTGMAAALIEIALGRTEEQALTQYLLSNELRPNKDRSSLRFFGVPKDLVKDIDYCERTHEELFWYALDVAKEKYGNIENLLGDRYGITDERRTLWQKNYLTV